MSRPHQKIVMDVLPWPDGHNFAGAGDWWNYILSTSERQKLDSLLGLALLDQSICKRLLIQRDQSLLESFGLSADTCAWLQTVQAATLTELAEVILARSGTADKEWTTEPLAMVS